MLAGPAVEKIQQAGRKIFEALVAQRPDRRPFDLGRSDRTGPGPACVSSRGRRRRLLPPILRVAEQQDVVWRNGLAWREIREPPRHSDLVALKNPGIALDRLHERAGFALLGGAALAEAAAAQSRPELVDGLGGRGKIVRGKVVGVQGQIGFDPLETRDHAGERAHVLAETCNRGPRRNGPIPAARHDQLAAGAKLDRRRRTAGVAQLLAAAAGHCGRAAT